MPNAHTDNWTRAVTAQRFKVFNDHKPSGPPKTAEVVKTSLFVGQKSLSSLFFPEADD